jgi:hypothetical protein
MSTIYTTMRNKDHISIQRLQLLLLCCSETFHITNTADGGNSHQLHAITAVLEIE